MEPTLSQIKLAPIPKPSIRRQSKIRYPIKSQLLPQSFYTIDQLKILVFLCFINKFDQQRLFLIQKYQEQVLKKLTKRQLHFNKLSSTITIQPTNKKILDLNFTNQIFLQIQQLLINQFKFIQNKSKTHSHHLYHNVKNSSYSLSMVELAKKSNYLTSISEFQTIPQNIKYRNTYKQYDNKQNTLFSTSKQKKIHKKYDSDYIHTFKTDPRKSNTMSIDNNQSQSKQLMNAKRKQQYFISKKKKQVDNLKKMTVCLSTQKTLHNTFVNIIEIFTKNIQKAVRYTKLIQQDQNKCKKISIYIQQLIKIYQSILNAYQILAKSDHSHQLQLIYNNSSQKSQFLNLTQISPFLIQYYQKSSQVIKISNIFVSTPVLSKILSSSKNQHKQLIQLISQARYILKCLQKQIQQIGLQKKLQNKIQIWQKIYISKYLSKKIYN